MLLIGVFVLAWTAAATFGLARVLARTRPPRRAAWLAWQIAAVVNGVAAYTAAPGEPWAALTLVLACQLLMLPILLIAARREAAWRTPEA